MKLVAFFVPGGIQAAIDVVNELHLTYEFAQMLPCMQEKPSPVLPFKGVMHNGHTIFVRLTDQRTHWLNNQLKDRGL